ncbi:hypothetical protein [Alkalihalobacillus deserti]|uniref:hypothetical protein n=1 Tax=Alkalihalobacillus deserti TaxID=2879466 RepID=UPI001D156364|nr:hypothetical protein [Alkalihalobacillus deserti]
MKLINLFNVIITTILLFCFSISVVISYLNSSEFFPEFISFLKLVFPTFIIAGLIVALVYTKLKSKRQLHYFQSLLLFALLGILSSSFYMILLNIPLEILHIHLLSVYGAILFFHVHLLYSWLSFSTSMTKGFSRVIYFVFVLINILVIYLFFSVSIEKPIQTFNDLNVLKENVPFKIQTPNPPDNVTLDFGDIERRGGKIERITLYYKETEKEFFSYDDKDERGFLLFIEKDNLPYQYNDWERTSIDNRTVYIEYPSDDINNAMVMWQSDKFSYSLMGSDIDYLLEIAKTTK